MESENVVVAAPMSFAGSAARLWKLTRKPKHPAWIVTVYTLVVIAIALAWTVILCWYLLFGLLLIPYRLIRRGQRKQRKEELRHREVLEAQKK